ncbi:MAG: type III-B CRISPR module-associated Cmr3 family protein [Cyanobacteria bacterium P01_D01_bin.6]
MTPSENSENLSPFAYLIAIHPLGLLYGSAGPFLSPENLVGRAGASFPPSAATLSGVFAAQHGNDNVQNLQLAGPFWANTQTIEPHNKYEQDFYVPTPMTYLVKKGESTISNQLSWQQTKTGCGWRDRDGKVPIGKYESNTWVSIKDWHNPTTVLGKSWEFVPHLHPRLELDQRRVAPGRNALAEGEVNQGSLFLENAVQLNADCCLVYLANEKLPTGWYRFGGEGHMVEITCHELQPHIRKDLLSPDSLGRAFATITPAVWGSNRLSERYPAAWRDLLTVGNPESSDIKESILTAKPMPFRYRMGGPPDKPKRLSRGRYAVPAGAVYVLRESLETLLPNSPSTPWHQWPDDWFPKEGPHMNRWGCGLALSLPSAISSSAGQKASSRESAIA